MVEKSCNVRSYFGSRIDLRRLNVFIMETLKARMKLLAVEYSRHPITWSSMTSLEILNFVNYAKVLNFGIAFC